MRAVVYHGPGDRRLENVPDPRIEDPKDVIVRVTTSTICGRTCISYGATFRPSGRARCSATKVSESWKRRARRSAGFGKAIG